MEAIAALSLASTIFQIVDFSAKLFTLSKGIYHSGDGLLAEAVDTEHLAMTLAKGLQRLEIQERLQVGHDDDLKRLCNRTTTLVHELSSVLDKVRSKSGKTKWGSVKLAMKSIGLQGRVESLGNSFKSLLAEIQLYFIVRTSEQANQRTLAIQKLQLDMGDVKGLITQYSKSVTDLISLRDKKPNDLGYTWECGYQVMVDDGLGDVQPFPLDICLDIEDFMDVLSIKFRSRNLPGLKQTELGHIEVLDWGETTTLTHENWSSYVSAGAGVKVSFVVGTWHGLRRKKCARCAKPHSQYPRKGEWREWRECGSCGLRLCQVSPETLPCEAIDFCHTPTMYRDYKLKGRPRSKSFGSQDDVCCGKKHKQENSPSPIRESTSYNQRRLSLEDQPAIELVCRRLTVKWEPMFNIVHRYLYCRCVLRLSTPSRLPQNPAECTFLVFAECPRHNSEGIAFQDYGDMVNNHDDPYFDRFGGYDAFRFGLAVQSKTMLNQLGGSDFLHVDEFQACCDAFHNVNSDKIEELNDAWVEYEFEVNSRLGWLGYELPPDVLSRLETYRMLKEEPDSSKWDKYTWLSDVDWDDCHLVKEPLEILDGSWDGRPHWAVD